MGIKLILLSCFRLLRINVFLSTGWIVSSFARFIQTYTGQLTGSPMPDLLAHTENVGSCALCISSHSHLQDMAARLATVLLKFILILVTK